ncbi:MAG: arsenate reductase ArsC [bacterium]|nr:arsenate reductase ArsC [bacterium]
MKVLILCTGNSCRSQMAEGFLQALAPHWTVRSAGTKPSGAVHPKAVQVMSEAGVDLSAHSPESVELYLSEPWDLVWTVCGGAKESCPSFAGKVQKRIHIGFDDPADFVGPEAEVLQGFRRVREEIQATCKQLVTEYGN